MHNYKNTLIIDDDAIFVFVFQKLLARIQNFGIIHKCSNGQMALEFLNKPDVIYPDIVFLDLNMPVMDGWQFLDEIQISNKLLNVFVASSTIDKVDIQKINTMIL